MHAAAEGQVAEGGGARVGEETQTDGHEQGLGELHEAAFVQTRVDGHDAQVALCNTNERNVCNAIRFN